MTSEETPNYICFICKQPVDLTKDRYADEDGKIVHEECYIEYLRSQLKRIS